MSDERTNPDKPQDALRDDDVEFELRGRLKVLEDRVDRIAPAVGFLLFSVLASAALGLLLLTIVRKELSR